MPHKIFAKRCNQLKFTYFGKRH